MNNLEERAVLGCLLLQNSLIETVRVMLSPEDFSNDELKSIYVEILRLSNIGSDVDLVTLNKGLKNKASLLSEIVSSVPSSSSYEFYVKQVKDISVTRELNLLSEIVKQELSNGKDSKDVIRLIEKRIVELSVDNTQKDTVTLNDSMTEVVEHIEKLLSDPKDTTGIRTGFETLDKKINGLNNTDLIILAARPGCGKSSFALQIAKNAALHSNAATMFFSLEMGKDQLTQRILCSDSKVDLWKIRSGKLDDLEMEVIRGSVKKLKDSPLFFNDMSSISLKDIRSQIRLHNAKSDKNIELVIVDYLQLMTSSKKTTIDQVTEITKGLKQIAKEFNIPVIALSQLSRAVEARGGKPRLSDLRDSGSIEQDADIVMFLHQDKNLEGPLGTQPVELLIEKHRNGATGDICLDFNGSKMNFTENVFPFEYK